MKKLSVISLLLALVMALQLLPAPVLATETEGQNPPEEGQQTVVTDGNVTVVNGCRTTDAQMPLGGSDRMLDTAVSAFIYERNTGTVVYAYNPDIQMQPGTLAKIVAAIVAIEYGDLEQQVTVSSRNYRYIPAGAKNAKLKEGEVLKLRDLVYCMFLEWANDAAVTIAEHVAGTEEQFVKLMNQWAQEAGCTGTKFSDCHGLGSQEQSVTARDLVKIVDHALKNAEFRELFGANAYTVPETNKTAERKLKALNYLKEETYAPKYNYKGVTGGIAHYSEKSGASLVCTAERDGMAYTIVVMGCERTFASNGWTVLSYGNYEEAWDLLEYVFGNYKICRLLHDGQSLTQFTVAGGENQVVVQAHTSMDAILPVNARTENLILKYEVAGGGLTAPIALDQEVGKLEIWYRNSCIAKTELYAMSSVRAVEKSELEIQSPSRDDSNVSGIMSFLGIVSLVILVPLVGYLVINNVRRTLARNRRRRRRISRRRSK